MSRGDDYYNNLVIDTIIDISLLTERDNHTIRHEISKEN
jgi:hypothetical protein